MTAAGGPRVLVIVPAHNEERVIARGVRALLDAPGVTVRVLVVPNGCTDATADRARGLGDPRVDVLELPQGGKAGAVRAGLAASRGEDVVAIVDADLVLDSAVLPGLAASLSGPAPLIAAPSLDLDTTGCSPLVRRHYRTWQREIHLRAGDIGARGIYAVNPAGLDRLRAMPDILADDAWARAVFAPHERVVSAGTSTVFPARTLRAQIRRRVRVLAGNRELRRVLPPGARPPALPGTPAVVTRTWRSRLREDGPLGAAAHYAIDLPARTIDAWHRLAGRDAGWGTDATTRG